MFFYLITVSLNDLVRMISHINKSTCAYHLTLQMISHIYRTKTLRVLVITIVCFYKNCDNPSQIPSLFGKSGHIQIPSLK